jgi:hypothetical protein
VAAMIARTFAWVTGMVRLVALVWFCCFASVLEILSMYYRAT